MQIKAADDVRPDIEALRALLRRPDLTARTRGEIESEIRTTQAGAEGERQAAYEIEFYCSNRENQATIHGLRLEIDGRTAQIDHLIINRLLDIWVCESKHFDDRVEINEHGEWTRFYHGRPVGMPSPIEQNNRHIAVLKDVLTAGSILLPSRMGVSVKPWIRGLVLVSNGAQILRPPGNGSSKIKGLETVVKVERAIETINGELDHRNPAALVKFIRTKELETFARALAALHVPAKFDWGAKFGIPAALDAEPTRQTPSIRPRCVNCGRAVTDAVIEFCLSRPAQFAGQIYCVDCQIPIISTSK